MVVHRSSNCLHGHQNQNQPIVRDRLGIHLLHWSTRRHRHPGNRICLGNWFRKYLDKHLLEMQVVDCLHTRHYLCHSIECHHQGMHRFCHLLGQMYSIHRCQDLSLRTKCRNLRRSFRMLERFSNRLETTIVRYFAHNCCRYQSCSYLVEAGQYYLRRYLLKLRISLLLLHHPDTNSFQRLLVAHPERNLKTSRTLRLIYSTFGSKSLQHTDELWLLRHPILRKLPYAFHHVTNRLN